MTCRPPWDQPGTRAVATAELEDAVVRHARTFWLPAAVATAWLGITLAVLVWSVL